MSLHSIVSDGLAGRFLRHPRAARAVAAEHQPTPLAVGLSGVSMRVLETGLAAAAIAVAILLGLGR